MGNCYSVSEVESQGGTLCGSFRDIQSPQGQVQMRQKAVAKNFDAVEDGYQIDEDVLYVYEVQEKLEEAMQHEVQASYAEYYNAWVESQLRERPSIDYLKVEVPPNIRQMMYKDLQIRPDETLYAGTWDTNKMSA
jgi:hypothetical protein